MESSVKQLSLFLTEKNKQKKKKALSIMKIENNN